VHFLANRTNGRAYGTTSCRSVCLSVVCNVCIVAKRYVLPKKRSEDANRVANLPDRYFVVPIWTPCDPPFPQTWVLHDCTPKTLHCKLRSNRFN